MAEIVKFNDVEQTIINLRGQSVILDSDVATLYGVETKEINQAVKNNPDKFPATYTIQCEKAEKNELVKKFDRFQRLKHSTVTPTAFTEKGLYMLATILKSDRATQTTIAIVETFAQIRDFYPDREAMKNGGTNDHRNNCDSCGIRSMQKYIFLNLRKC